MFLAEMFGTMTLIVLGDGVGAIANLRACAIWALHDYLKGVKRRAI